MAEGEVVAGTLRESGSSSVPSDFGRRLTGGASRAVGGVEG